MLVSISISASISSSGQNTRLIAAFKPKGESGKIELQESEREVLGN